MGNISAWKSSTWIVWAQSPRCCAREARHLDHRRVIQRNRWCRSRCGLDIEPNFCGWPLRLPAINMHHIHPRYDSICGGCDNVGEMVGTLLLVSVTIKCRRPKARKSWKARGNEAFCWCFKNQHFFRKTIFNIAINSISIQLFESVRSHCNKDLPLKWCTESSCNRDEDRWKRFSPPRWTAYPANIIDEIQRQRGRSAAEFTWMAG